MPEKWYKYFTCTNSFNACKPPSVRYSFYFTDEETKA